MEIGVYYYPEHWEESQWERDIKKMAEMGFTFTHIGEFAWAKMEPTEGKFDFVWLDKVLNLCEKYKIKVILCTPTPCPPAWLAKKHPEMFVANSNYIQINHGSRGNYSYSSDIFKQYAEKIISELAKHYANDKRIWGWQLDNEPAAWGDYSPVQHEKFRVWLKNKYQNIENLNKAWGAAFWSLTYNDFSQIDIPNEKLYYGINPSSLMDYKRFYADQSSSFLNFQNDVLRKYIAKNQWITTNYIGMITNVEPRRSDKLDFIAYTAYPVSGARNLGDLGFRLGSPDIMMYSNDYYRPIKGVTGIMELQPGQVNWGYINPQPQPGAVRMWLYHGFAGGLSFACTYRFRQPLAGSEHYHYGIIGTDGVTPSRGGLEYAQVAGEMNTLKQNYNPKASEPAPYANRRTGILMNHENIWDLDHEKQSGQWNAMNHLMKYLKITKSFNCPVDFLSEKSDFEKYKTLIAPAYSLIDSDLVKKWTKYVENGGNLILTCRTGIKNKNVHLWEAKWAKPIYNLIGAELEFFDMLLEDGKGQVSFQNQTFDWNNWADVLTPLSGTQVWGEYKNQFYAGKTAITQRKLGKGTVTYIGVDTDNAQLEKEVLRKVYTDSGIALENYPEGVLVEWRDGFWVAVNYSSNPYTFPERKGRKFLIGDAELSPADVAVWAE